MRPEAAEKLPKLLLELKHFYNCQQTTFPVERLGKGLFGFYLLRACGCVCECRRREVSRRKQIFRDDFCVLSCVFSCAVASVLCCEQRRKEGKKSLAETKCFKVEIKIEVITMMYGNEVKTTSVFNGYHQVINPGKIVFEFFVHLALPSSP